MILMIMISIIHYLQCFLLHHHLHLCSTLLSCGRKLFPGHVWELVHLSSHTMTRITFIIIIIIIMVPIIIITTRAMTRANDWNQLLTIVALADSWLPYPIMPNPYHTRSSVPSLTIPGLLSRPSCTISYHTRSSVHLLYRPAISSLI